MITAADSRNVAAFTRYTNSTSATASRKPPSAGPTKKPMLSIVEATTLALVSSRGSIASRGSRAACAGRKASDSSPVSRARPNTASAGPSAAMTTAATTTTTARVMSAPIITRLRGNRSASVAANGARIAMLT